MLATGLYQRTAIRPHRWYDKPNQDYLREIVEQFAKIIRVSTSAYCGRTNRRVAVAGIKLDGDM
jgi:hypothetical protein